MQVSVHNAMRVQEHDCTRKLSKDKKQTRGREVRLAELFPQMQVVGGLRLKHNCVDLWNQLGLLLNV